MTYDDGAKLTFNKQDVTNALDIRGRSEWEAAHESLAAAFQYLEDRLTDAPTVDQPYRLGRVHSVCSALRVFNPAFIRQQAELQCANDLIERLRDIPWVCEDTVVQMRAELPALLVAVNESALDFSLSSINDFTHNVLLFWRTVKHCGSWRHEARRAFCLTPNSAASERVFSVLKAMFDDSQSHSLSDYIEGSVMLAFNERELG